MNLHRDRLRQSDYKPGSMAVDQGASLPQSPGQSTPMHKPAKHSTTQSRRHSTSHLTYTAASTIEQVHRYLPRSRSPKHPHSTAQKPRKCRVGCMQQGRIRGSGWKRPGRLVCCALTAACMHVCERESHDDRVWHRRADGMISDVSLEAMMRSRGGSGVVGCSKFCWAEGEEAVKEIQNEEAGNLKRPRQSRRAASSRAVQD